MKINTIQPCRYNAGNYRNTKNNTPAFKGLQFLYTSDKTELLPKLSEEGNKVLKEAIEAKYNLKELCGYDNGLHRIGKEVINMI